MNSIDLNRDNFSKREGSNNHNDENDEETLSVYNDKELYYLDKYLLLVKNAFDVRKIILLYFYRRTSCIKSSLTVILMTIK